MTARLMSVNVGMPKDVPWNGKTVHTGVWKTPVEGAVMVRRLNIDGDGQGDLAGHGGEQRAVMVYQTDRIDYWRDYLGRDDLRPGNFGENFTVSGLDDPTSASATATGSATPSSKSPSPASPAFASACVWVCRDAQPSCLPTPPGLLLQGHHRGSRPSGRRYRADPPRPPRTQRRRRRRAALPARPRYGTAAQGRRRARAEPRLAAVVPRHARRRRKIKRPNTTFVGVSTRMARIPAVMRHRHPPGESDGAVDHARSRRWWRPSDAASRPIPHREDSGAGDPPPMRSYSLSGDPAAGYYRISVKREDRGQVSRWLHSHAGSGLVIESASPRGDFYLVDDASPVILVSAGIGATPVMAMAHALAAAKSPRQIWWLHTTQSSATLAFAAEVTALLDALPDAHQLVFYTRGDGVPRA